MMVHSLGNKEEAVDDHEVTAWSKDEKTNTVFGEKDWLCLVMVDDLPNLPFTFS